MRKSKKQQTGKKQANKRQTGSRQTADRAAGKRQIDSRQAGKIKKKRARRRKNRIFSALRALASFALVAGAIIAAIVIFFKITDISVVGNSLYSASDIIKETSLKVGENMFAFDKFSIIKKIKKKFPFIKDIQIDRKLPDKIVITTEEYQSAGYIEENGVFWLISSDGKLLKNGKIQDGDTQISECAQIVGITLENPVVGEILEISEKDKKKPLIDILQSIEKSAILKKVSKIDVSKLYRITMLYDGRFTVKLGSSEDIDKKIGFLSVVEQQLLPTDIGTIDVSDTKQARFIPYEQQAETEDSPDGEDAQQEPGAQQEQGTQQEKNAQQSQSGDPGDDGSAPQADGGSDKRAQSKDE